jgi:hypothetical protein
MHPSVPVDESVWKESVAGFVSTAATRVVTSGSHHPGPVRPKTVTSGDVNGLGGT